LFVIATILLAGCHLWMSEQELCSSEIDRVQYFPDADGDGFGSAVTPLCEERIGHVSNALDCDDDDETLNPASTELCGDGVDNDCDGLIDAEQAREWSGCTHLPLEDIYIGLSDLVYDEDCWGYASSQRNGEEILLKFPSIEDGGARLAYELGTGDNMPSLAVVPGTGEIMIGLSNGRLGRVTERYDVETEQYDVEILFSDSGKENRISDVGVYYWSNEILNVAPSSLAVDLEGWVWLPIDVAVLQLSLDGQLAQRHALPRSDNDIIESVAVSGAGLAYASVGEEVYRLDPDDEEADVLYYTAEDIILDMTFDGEVLYLITLGGDIWRVSGAGDASVVVTNQPQGKIAVTPDRFLVLFVPNLPTSSPRYFSWALCD